MSDKILIEIRNAGNNVQIVPMGEDNALFKIIANGKVVTENVTRQAADSLVQQSKNNVILG